MPVKNNMIFIIIIFTIIIIKNIKIFFYGLRQFNLDIEKLSNIILINLYTYIYNIL